MNLLSRFRKKAPLLSVECAPLQSATFKAKAGGPPVQGLRAGEAEPFTVPSSASAARQPQPFDMRTKLTTLALASALAIGGLAQTLPTTGTIDTRLGKLEIINSFSAEKNI